MDLVVEKRRAAHLPFQDWSDVLRTIWVGEAPAIENYDHAFFAHPLEPY